MSMDRPDKERTLAIFCDHENVALGAQQARYPFDIHLILERLLDKGKVIVKKAYSDWSRYQAAKRPLHEAAFELIEVPHLSYSGKNSADIRLVVDALDLCYTKKHIDTFVIVSGDSDFSPLVSKLRENNKFVIGLGVKNSTSDLLIESCDDFIYYDELVLAARKARAKALEKAQAKAKAKTQTKPKERVKPQPEKKRREESGAPEPTAAATSEAEGDAEQPDRAEAMEIVLSTVEALFREREGNIWGSMIKQTLKRKRPNFSEGFYGYRSFSDLLKDAQKRKMLELQKDERSGGYLVLGFGEKA